MNNRNRFYIFLLMAGAALITNAQSTGKLPVPKNIIVMIGDGMGYNHIQALNYFKGEKTQTFEDFPVKLALSHYPAKAGEYIKDNPASNYIATGYNPSLAWSDTGYLKRNFTESAASATALATGYKTYNNSIGMSVDHDTLENLVQWAKATGRSAGVVTSVPFSHATPAGFTAHNVTRSNYAEIAAEMLLDSRCDVIMGCGDPGFDGDGLPVKGRWTRSKYVGDSIFWQNIVAGSGERIQFTVNGQTKTINDADGDGKPDPWTLVRDVKDFLSLQHGKTPVRVLGVAKVSQTLQQGRSKRNGEENGSLPGTTPALTSVPALRDMTLGALNVLDNNNKGFFLMVEGGAIDWAAHGHQKGRLIEEMDAFSQTVDAVVEWVERNSSWDETLVVVTADHETGLLWGENPYKPLIDGGKGNLPVMNFNSGDHTNALAPFFAKGAGSELYNWYADEYDPVQGYFLQNSELAQLIHFLWYK